MRIYCIRCLEEARDLLEYFPFKSKVLGFSGCFEMWTVLSVAAFKNAVFTILSPQQNSSVDIMRSYRYRRRKVIHSLSLSLKISNASSVLRIFSFPTWIKKKSPFWLTRALFSGEYNGQVAISRQEGRTPWYLQVIAFYLFLVCSIFVPQMWRA